jgi:hypothetical protein
MSTRLILLILLATLGAACGEPAEDDTAPPADSSPPDCSDEDVDGDGLDGCTEESLGTDPNKADSDGDGLSDAEEMDCASDPLDAEERCYACGWPHNDPGSLSSTGAALGDVVANIPFTDQCGELVDLWDFAEEYHILFITASW